MNLLAPLIIPAHTQVVHVFWALMGHFCLLALQIRSSKIMHVLQEIVTLGLLILKTKEWLPRSKFQMIIIKLYQGTLTQKSTITLCGCQIFGAALEKPNLQIVMECSR